MPNQERLPNRPWRRLIRDMEDACRSRLTHFITREDKGVALRNYLQMCFPAWYGTIDSEETNRSNFNAVLRTMASAYRRSDPNIEEGLTMAEMLRSSGVRFTNTDTVMIVDDLEPAQAAQGMSTEQAAQDQIQAWVAAHQTHRQVFNARNEAVAMPPPTQRPTPRRPLPALRERFESPEHERQWRDATRRIADLLYNSPPGTSYERGTAQMLLAEPLTDATWSLFQTEVQDRLEHFERRRKALPKRFVEQELEDVWNKLDIHKRRAYSDFASRTHAVYGNMGVQEVWPTDKEMFEYWLKQNPLKESETV